MAKKIRQLAKDTVIYGGTTILTRMLNWLLVPLYTYTLQEQGEYGIVINLYAWTALLLVVLTYGMETGFFRFVGDENKKDTVYSTTLSAIGITSAVFLVLVFFFSQPVGVFLQYENHTVLIKILGIILAIDAFTAIPFALLRYTNRPIRFAYIKIISVGVNIGFNLFFLILCPLLIEGDLSFLISWFYNPAYGVGYIFISNLFSSGIVFFLLLPEILQAQFKLDKAMLKKLLAFSWPLLIVGIAGIINQSGDKILYPFLINDPGEALKQLGIYGANYKIAVIMVMFTQGFRYAFEPFIFRHNRESDSKKEYADVLKYFTIFGMIIFLGVMFYIDIVKYFIKPSYHSGLNVVPIVLIANLFYGMFFTLSVWYKLTDKTIYGAVLAVVGSVITIAINLIFVPQYGYIASAWANLACFTTMLLLSFILSQKYFPVPYETFKILFYIAVGLMFYFVDSNFLQSGSTIDYVLKTALFTGYLFFIFRYEGVLRLIKK